MNDDKSSCIYQAVKHGIGSLFVSSWWTQSWHSSEQTVLPYQRSWSGSVWHRWLSKNVACARNAWMISSWKLLWSTKLTASSWNIGHGFSECVFFGVLLDLFLGGNMSFCVYFRKQTRKKEKTSSSNAAIPLVWWTELQSVGSILLVAEKL